MCVNASITRSSRCRVEPSLVLGQQSPQSVQEILQLHCALEFGLEIGGMRERERERERVSERERGRERVSE